MSIYIIFGSETGNAETYALQTKSTLTELGVAPTLHSADDVELTTLNEGDVLLVHISTWGDGDAPSNAYKFVDSLKNDIASVNGVQFSVFAIGSTNFSEFCQAGKDVDELLSHKGGVRIADLVLSDEGNYDADYNAWMTNVKKALPL